jgi:hypothetical protein
VTDGGADFTAQIAIEAPGDVAAAGHGQQAEHDDQDDALGGPGRGVAPCGLHVGADLGRQGGDRFLERLAGRPHLGGVELADVLQVGDRLTLLDDRLQDRGMLSLGGGDGFQQGDRARIGERAT